MVSSPSAHLHVLRYTRAALDDAFSHGGAGKRSSVSFCSRYEGAPRQSGMAPGTAGLMQVPVMMENRRSLHSFPEVQFRPTVNSARAGKGERRTHVTPDTLRCSRPICPR